MSKLKIITPRSELIEKVAAEYAGIFYDAARSSGLKVIKLGDTRIDLLKCKTARNFARRYLEKFIPEATKNLISMLGRSDIRPEMKEQIYESVMERVNDEQVNDLGKLAGLPEFQENILYKDDSEKPKPIIIKAVKDMLDGSKT